MFLGLKRCFLASVADADLLDLVPTQALARGHSAVLPVAATRGLKVVSWIPEGAQRFRPYDMLVTSAHCEPLPIDTTVRKFLESLPPHEPSRSRPPLPA